MADLDFNVWDVGDAQEFEDNVGETEENEEVDDSDQVATGQGDVELHNSNLKGKKKRIPRKMGGERSCHLDISRKRMKMMKKMLMMI
jgi:hypothetical protein